MNYEKYAKTILAFEYGIYIKVFRIGWNKYYYPYTHVMCFEGSTIIRDLPEMKVYNRIGDILEKARECK